MLEQILREGCAQMSLEINEKALADFRYYYQELDEKNKVMNLTAITGEAESARLHFLDSLSPLLVTKMDGCSVIDVGTGAGFPGLPLRIACPGIHLTLLDSLNKRVDFLKGVCEGLGYGDVECVHARAEECAERREQYDYAVSRAVARLNVLCEFCLPYVKVGGAFLALKGPALVEELAEAEKAITQLGGKLEQVFEYAIPGEDAHHNIALIRKVAPTPKKFPRRFAQIKKAPL